MLDERALLVVIDAQLPPAHEVHVGATRENRLHLAAMGIDYGAGLAYLPRVTCVEEESRFESDTVSSGFTVVPAAMRTLPVSSVMADGTTTLGSK